MTTEEKKSEMKPEEQSEASGVPSYMTGEQSPPREDDTQSAPPEAASAEELPAHADNEELTPEGKDFFNILQEQDGDFASQDEEKAAPPPQPEAAEPALHLGKAVEQQAAAFAVSPDGTTVRQHEEEAPDEQAEEHALYADAADNGDDAGEEDADAHYGGDFSSRYVAPDSADAAPEEDAPFPPPAAPKKPSSQSFFKSHPILGVEQTAPPSMASRFFNLLALLPILPLTIIFILQTLFTLDARGLWFGDEVRYADAFTHLLHQGKGILLEVNGAAFTDKPPLYFWALKGLHWLVRTDGPMLFFAASALSGLLFLWVSLGLGRFVGRVDGRTNLAAGIILLSMIFFVGASHYASMDLLFAALVLCSHIALFMAFASPRNSFVGMVIAFLFAGAATLVNGPLGLVLPILTVVLFAVWRGGKDQIRALLLMVFAVACGLLPLLAGLHILQTAGYLPGAETLPMEWGLAFLGVPALLLLAVAALSKTLRLAALLSLVLLAGAFVLGGGTPYFAWPLVYTLPVCALAVLAAMQATPQRLFRLDFFIGLAVGIAVSLLWFGAIYYESGNHEFILNTLLQGQVLERTLQGLHDSRAWHHYLPLVPLVLLPWTIVLFFLPYTGIVRQKGREGLAASRGPEKEGLAFLWCSVIASLLLVCLFGDRSLLHLLPAVPALAILAARAVLGFAGARAKAFQLGMAGLMLVFGILGIVASLMLFGYLPLPSFSGISWQIAPHGSFFAVAAILLVAGALIWLGIGSARTEGVFLVMALAGLLLAYPVTGMVAGILDQYMNPQPQALMLKAYMDEGYSAHAYNTPDASYAYYAQKAVPKTDDPATLGENSIVAMPKAEADAWADKPACMQEAHKQWLGTEQYVLMACPPKEGITPGESPLAPAPDILKQLFGLAGLEVPFKKEARPEAPKAAPAAEAPATVDQAPAEEKAAEEPAAEDEGKAAAPADAAPADAAPETPADAKPEAPAEQAAPENEEPVQDAASAKAEDPQAPAPEAAEPAEPVSAEPAAAPQDASAAAAEDAPAAPAEAAPDAPEAATGADGTTDAGQSPQPGTDKQPE